MRSAKQFSPQFSYKNVEYDFNIFIVIKFFFRKKIYTVWPIKLKLDLHGLWGRLELQDFCDNMTSVFSCDQLGLAEFSVFTVYVTNICSKTCLCTWVIVPIFWSSTFTCPIFAIEEQNLHFHAAFCDDVLDTKLL